MSSRLSTRSRYLGIRQLGSITSMLLFLLCAAQAFAQGGTWATKAPLPAANTGFASGVVNGVLYVAGGENCCQLFDALYAYDPATDSWTTKAPMPIAAANWSGGVVNNVFYVLGGAAGAFLGDVFAYDPPTDMWTAKAPLPTARANVMVAAVGGILYAIGGQDSSGLLADVEAYDPTTNMWNSRTPMPAGHSTGLAGVVNGVIYVQGAACCGGTTADGSFYAYDPVTNTWTIKASVPTVRFAPLGGVINGIFYVIGGGFNVTLATNEAYNPATDSWTTMTAKPTPSYFGSGAVVGSTLYGLGGQNGGVVIATNEAFSPPCSNKIVSTDNAGNVGFTAPVLNPGSGSLPNVNSANVKQPIPMQVTVTDCNGNPITNLALAPTGTVVLSAQNQTICNVDNPDNSINTNSAGNSGWQNLGSGVYQYTWKPLPPKGACLSFSLNLGDGVQHIAYFQFK